MSEQVKRYDAVHLRYEDNNIRYGEGCEVEVVTASDYAALEAENARLQSAFDELAERYGKLQTGEDSLLARVVTERDAALAQLAAIQGGMGETIEPCADLNHHERYRAGWNACLAQHQRITAALAAEVAAWRNCAVMLEQANAGVAQLNGELRSEIAELREALRDTARWIERLPVQAQGAIRQLERIDTALTRRTNAEGDQQ